MRKQTKEDYIEAIFVLEKQDGRARTGKLAVRLGVKPPSITEMLGKLQEEELVNYQSYAGVTLTPKGKTLAKKCMHRHRLLADLFEMIGVEQEQAEVDAAQVGHHISPATMAQLGKLLEFVQANPNDPPWIDCFRHYCETGERVHCPGLKGKV